MISNDLNQFWRLLKMSPILEGKGMYPYDNVASLKHLATFKYIESGLDPEEARLYRHIDGKPGRALMIGCSAGRECVYLVKRGEENIPRILAITFGIHS